MVVYADVANNSCSREGEVDEWPRSGKSGKVKCIREIPAEHVWKGAEFARKARAEGVEKLRELCGFFEPASP